MRVNYLTRTKWWSTAQVSERPDHKGLHHGWDESTKRTVSVIPNGDRWVEARD